jgi:hypothetical protein
VKDWIFRVGSEIWSETFCKWRTDPDSKLKGKMGSGSEKIVSDQQHWKKDGWIFNFFTFWKKSPGNLLNPVNNEANKKILYNWPLLRNVIQPYMSRVQTFFAI